MPAQSTLLVAERYDRPGSWQGARGARDFLASALGRMTSPQPGCVAALAEQGCGCKWASARNNAPIEGLGKAGAGDALACPTGGPEACVVLPARLPLRCVLVSSSTAHVGLHSRSIYAVLFVRRPVHRQRDARRTAARGRSSRQRQRLRYSLLPARVVRGSGGRAIWMDLMAVG